MDVLGFNAAALPSTCAFCYRIGLAKPFQRG